MSSIDLTTTATVPTNTSLSVTVYEDTDGDGVAENSATQSVAGGTNTYSLAGFDAASGNDYWLDVQPDNSDVTATASLDSATLDVPVAGSLVLLNSNAVLQTSNGVLDTE